MEAFYQANANGNWIASPLAQQLIEAGRKALDAPMNDTAREALYETMKKNLPSDLVRRDTAIPPTDYHKFHELEQRARNLASILGKVTGDKRYTSFVTQAEPWAATVTTLAVLEGLLGDILKEREAKKVEPLAVETMRRKTYAAGDRWAK